MAGPIKRFMSYLNKEDFNHNQIQGSVDPYKFHRSFTFLAKLFNMMDDEVKPWWIYYNIVPIYVICNGIASVTIFSYSLMIYVRKLQIHLITECGTYWILMIYKLIILSCIFRNRKYFHKLFKELQADFEYIGSKGQKYSKDFYENQKLTFKLCVLAGLFNYMVAGFMVVCACIASIYTTIVHDQNYHRPLPYPMLFFNKEHKTPYYEIIFVLCVSFTFSHINTYIFMIQSQIIWVREITAKADIIIWNIDDLLVDVKPANNRREAEFYVQLIKHRMRDIIEMHQSMVSLLENYAAVYKTVLLYEQKLAAPVICMTGYCAAEKFDVGQVHFILILLCVSVILLEFIPSYLCTFLSEKVKSVSYACWNMPFWNAGPAIRPYAILMMQRAERPLPIIAAGFDDISLQTYSSIMTRAYSCFNMLRQSNFDFS